MHCYILHEANRKVQVSVMSDAKEPSENPEPSNVTTTTAPPPSIVPITRYVFPKEFHVSPFMEMNYQYDWKFAIGSDSIDITNALVRPDGKQQFHARMWVVPQQMSVWSLAWQLSCFPIYCAVIQLWIH